MPDTRTTAWMAAPPPPPPHPGSTPVPGVLQRLRSDCLYLLVSFPVGIVTFVLVVTGLAVGVGLAITLVGLPVLAMTLHLAGLAAGIERTRIAGVLDVHVPRASYRDPSPGGGRIAQLWTVVRDPQRWSEVHHGLIRFPVATVTWSVAIIWWSVAVAGVVYPVYVWVLPQSSTGTGLAELLGLTGRGWDIGLNLAIGVLAALALPRVMRGLAITQASLGRALLVRDTSTPAIWTVR